jgi:hypothetical protein
MNIKTFLLSFLMLSIQCTSHIFMKEPIVRRSRYSLYYLSNNLVDYNIMAPLNTNNYEFPCKGFPVKKTISVITRDTIQVELESVTVSDLDKHKGGHCQFGISFDNNEFIVLKQVIRNCVIDSLFYTIDLPRNIPDGKLIFFWTWINAIGNREYYMDCADIQLSRRNIVPSMSPILGKKLLIVNLPGYKTIPEFPNKNSYDGSELLLNIADMTLTPPFNYVTSIIGGNTTTSIIDTTTTTTMEPVNLTTTQFETTKTKEILTTTNSPSSLPTISLSTKTSTKMNPGIEFSNSQKTSIHINLITFTFCIIFYSLF